MSTENTETTTTVTPTATGTEVSQTETTTEKTPAQSAQTTQGQADKMGGVEGQEAVTTAASATATPPWSPNFKFKVKDKELEIEDLFKPLVKDKNSETKVRELYEKAHGLDEVKTSRDTFKTQAEEWKGKFTQVEDNLKTIGSYARKGDFGTFFELLNIPKEKIIQYAIEELKYQELPPEQRQAIEQQRKLQNDYETQTQQNQTLQQQMANLVTQQATMELNQALATPETVSSIAAFDARAGKPGAFKAEVIRRGQYYEAVHKISPPASQLVTEVLQLVGVQTQAPQGTDATSQVAPGQGSTTQKPVIPSFSGSSTKSPVQKVPTSIDDIRAIRQQRVQQQNA